jgi:hypothetical protein
MTEDEFRQHLRRLRGEPVLSPPTLPCFGPRDSVLALLASMDRALRSASFGHRLYWGRWAREHLAPHAKHAHATDCDFDTDIKGAPLVRFSGLISGHDSDDLIKWQLHNADGSSLYLSLKHYEAALAPGGMESVWAVLRELAEFRVGPVSSIIATSVFRTQGVRLLVSEIQTEDADRRLALRQWWGEQAALTLGPQPLIVAPGTRDDIDRTTIIIEATTSSGEEFEFALEVP